MPNNRILIIRTGALGDVILTLPVVQNLQRAHPHAHIHLLGNPRLLTLASNAHLHDIDRAQWARLFAPAAPTSLPEGLDAFDLAISYLPDPDGLFTHNLRKADVAEVLTCASRPSGETPIHAIDHLLTPLNQRGVPILDTQPRIALMPADHNAIASLHSNTPTLLIHPGSGSASKCWPTERFAQTADTAVQTTGCRVLISSGPADADRAQKVVRQMTAPAKIIDNLPLRHLAALMATCTCYLGNDSGPSHLAAAVGLPTLALFGPTDPAQWAPRGETVRTIRAFDKNIASIPPDRVTAHLMRILSP